MANKILRIVIVLAIIATIIVLATNWGHFSIEVNILLIIMIFFFIGFLIFVEYTEHLNERHEQLYKDVNRLKVRLDEYEEKNKMSKKEQ